MEPDLDGFRKAMVNLRETMGRDVPFFTPTPTTWPEGTAIDPQTGEPYDPTIEPISSGFTSAAVRALVVLPGAGVRADEVIAAAIGEVEEGRGVVVVGLDDWEAHDLEDATQVEIYDERWEIKQSDLDGVGPGAADRVIIHVEQRE